MPKPSLPHSLPSEVVQDLDRQFTPVSPLLLSIGDYQPQTVFHFSNRPASIDATNQPFEYAVITEGIAIARRILNLRRTQDVISFALSQPGDWEGISAPEDIQSFTPMPTVPPRNPKMSERIGDWLAGANMTIKIFESFSIADDDKDGVVFSAEPKILNLNYRIIAAAGAARRHQAGPASDFALLYLAVTITHECMHSMRKLIPEATRITPPRVNVGGREPEYGMVTVQGSLIESRRLRGEGGFWLERWLFGGEVVACPFRPSAECRFEDELVALRIQKYDPARYFRIDSAELTSVVTGSSGWDLCLPFRPLRPSMVIQGYADTRDPLPRDHFGPPAESLSGPSQDPDVIPRRVRR